MQNLSTEQIDDLIAILDGVIRGGASVGWVDPPPLDEMRAYWQSVIRPGNLLICGFDGPTIVATGQLELAQKENGNHRAEIAKVLVLPSRQGQGLGRLIMEALEDLARREKRTLIHLDTNADDTTNAFYQRLGWQMAGTIPNWARLGTDGQLHGTTFYFKQLRAPTSVERCNID
jgi:GNAT superfamily N-acetyltransferase